MIQRTARDFTMNIVRNEDANPAVRNLRVADGYIPGRLRNADGAIMNDGRVDETVLRITVGRNLAGAVVGQIGVVRGEILTVQTRQQDAFITPVRLIPFKFRDRRAVAVLGIGVGKIVAGNTKAIGRQVLVFRPAKHGAIKSAARIRRRVLAGRGGDGVVVREVGRHRVRQRPARRLVNAAVDRQAGQRNIGHAARTDSVSL